ncbi:MAG: DNA mismatch repair protein MutS [Lachnospiraceae bacterium]
MALSPMMTQYVATKEEYKDCILFYRLGDFYEMFFEDALTTSRELELTLTGKDCGLEERAPMCGVPYHAAEPYISRLVEKGYKVAICEQVSDPKTTKGLVKREVVRVVTPGTVLDSHSLDETKNNYILSVVCMDTLFGCAFADITTGETYMTEVESKQQLLDEISKFSPAEIVCNEAFLVSGIDLEDLKYRYNMVIAPLDISCFDDSKCLAVVKAQFPEATQDPAVLDTYPTGIIASGALFQYLHETQKAPLAHMTRVSLYSVEKYMIIDSSSRRNLELSETLREKKKRGTLLWILDKTQTAMGARRLRKMLEQPLLSTDDINARFDAIESLNASGMLRDEIREYLNSVYDMERLIGKISCQNANPRDLVSFMTSLEMLPHIKHLLHEFPEGILSQLKTQMDSLEDVAALIRDAIIEEPPIVIKEGGIIKGGYHQDVDTLRESKDKGKEWLTQLESRERERSGIKSLKVKYNRVFGYYLEVTNSFKDMVPQEYIRRQTLTNAERYTTAELKELESVILGAEDKLYALEYTLFTDIRKAIAQQVQRIQQTAAAVAMLDVLTSLALVSSRNRFVRPQLNTKGIIDIKNGRHPVVEQMISNHMFIPNDILLNSRDNRISIITGPNMAGKSTYMRQAALIVLMAQIGCFVPADKANIGVVDRIFTRVGASDDLASGQSTFMVEMTEVANILQNATANSLLILDEIGRGTSTFDGLSIAWAVIEYISNKKILGAKTLFATHYHELTELEGKLEGVTNYCIAVKEKGDEIVFLRKIVKGGADKSYGIQVAKLAGVPEPVIQRAKELVVQLSDADITAHVKSMAAAQSTAGRFDTLEMNQMSLFDTVKEDDIIQELRDTDITNLTPMEALNLLNKLQNKLNNRW